MAITPPPIVRSRHFLDAAANRMMTAHDQLDRDAQVRLRATVCTHAAPSGVRVYVQVLTVI